MHYLKLYARFIVVHMKSQMEYRIGFFMDHFILILYYSITYMGVWIILNKFHSVAGWSFYEVLLLFNLNLFSYSVSSLFFGFGSMRRVETMIQQGTFDSMLIYPLNPFLHVVFKQFGHTYFAHIALCIAVFFICFEKLNIIWSFTNVLWFSLVSIGGAMIQAAVMIFTGTMNFWFIRSTTAIDTSIQVMKTFVDYPITIYEKWVQIILTFIIPYAFITFYPVEHFLNKFGPSLFYGIALFDPLFQFGTPVVGVVSFLFSYTLWNFGINRYQSTGS